MKVTAYQARQTIADYRYRAQVVREIHSGTAEKKRTWDLAHTILTVVLGAAITFFGFMGTDKIWESISNTSGSPTITQGPETSSVDKNKSSNLVPSKKNNFDLWFNVAALGLFIISLLNLVFRWKEEHILHFQGVVKLTQFSNWLNEKEMSISDEVDLSVMREIRLTYQVIVEQLPPNNRKDYLSAKKRLALKEQKNYLTKKQSVFAAALSTDTESEIKIVVDFVKSSPVHMQVLAVLRGVDPNLWLGGGAIRSLVWDSISGRSTRFDDFDVVLFDQKELTAEADKKIELAVQRMLLTSIKIEVKNQARMHMTTHEPRRSSLEDAIMNWPETATSIAVRLNNIEEVEVLAPNGLSDILRMIVRPTKYHELHRTSYEKRKSEKAWQTTWPEIEYQDSIQPK